VRKSNKKFESIRVIRALGNYELIILQFSWAIVDCIRYQINQVAPKLVYYFTNYDQFTGHCWFEEMQD